MAARRKVRKATGVAAIAAVVSMLGVAPAGASSRGSQSNLYTYCYQGFNVKWGALLAFAADGQGYGQIGWGIYTKMPWWGGQHTYDNYSAASGYPDLSCSYPSNFLAQQWQVMEDGNFVQNNRYGTSALSSINEGRVQPYPEEDTNYTLESWHDWAASERCGVYWRSHLRAAASVPPYDVHNHPGFMAQPDIITTYQTGVGLTAPLIGNVESTPIDLVDGVGSVPLPPLGGASTSGVDTSPDPTIPYLGPTRA